MQELIVAKDIRKSFNGNSKLEVLKNVNLTINKGDFIAITGPSGSGKTTLLYLLSALDIPTSGDIFIGSSSTKKLRDNELTKLRQKYVGLVFQFHFLLSEFTALDNLIVPQLIAKVPYPKALKVSLELLDKVGLSDRKEHRPSQLSGGEQQRVAVARALVNNPLVLLTDEPTGNLDRANSRNIFKLFKKLNEDYNQTIVVVTHDMELANQAKKIIELVDGQIKSEKICNDNVKILD